MLRIVLAAIAATIATALLATTARAVPIHVHEKVPIKRQVTELTLVKGDPVIARDTVKDIRIVERVKHVPPVDKDDDGIADRNDSCIGDCSPTIATSPAPSGGAGAPPAAIAECESGGDPTAVNPAGYYGKWQFDMGTWASVGGTGNPAEASEAEQDYRAGLLYQRAGPAPWPVCGQ